MSREATLIVIGIVLALFSFFSGLPFSFLRWIFAALGIIVVVIGYAQRKHHVAALAAETTAV